MGLKLVFMETFIGLDNFYKFDEDRLQGVRKGLAWLHDPKYFKRVKISPSAAVKMMMHGQSGVEKGIKKAGKPIEVMGLLLGRPDYEDPHLLIISDAQALPIEGFETRVIAEDESVINYMIELNEMNENSRKERFCGWYHTHPFDVDVNSHCYLSTTDTSTQLQWQRAEDPHGNPWVAIVIDPLRSLAKGRPELMAFRAYPPDYMPPNHETPDGIVVPEERNRIEKWGACWNRYYKLEISYFMSTLARNTLGVLRDNFMWMDPLVNTSALNPGSSMNRCFTHLSSSSSSSARIPCRVPKKTCKTLQIKSRCCVGSWRCMNLASDQDLVVWSDLGTARRELRPPDIPIFPISHRLCPLQSAGTISRYWQYRRSV